jgi:hypothetical protein
MEDIHEMFKKFSPTKMKRSTKRKTLYPGGLFIGCQAKQIRDVASSEDPLVTITKIETNIHGEVTVHHIHKGKTGEMKAGIDSFELIK